jgi:hypothetical protein
MQVTALPWARPAECDRVMAVTDITEIPDDQLQLVDTVCVNREDPLAPLGHRD